MSDHKKLKLT